jgi:hypothetical protein
MIWLHRPWLHLYLLIHPDGNIIDVDGPWIGLSTGASCTGAGAAALPVIGWRRRLTGGLAMKGLRSWLGAFKEIGTAKHAKHAKGGSGL